GPLALGRDAECLVYADSSLRCLDFRAGGMAALSQQALLVRLLATAPGGAVAGVDANGTLRVWRRGRPVRALPNFVQVRTLAVSRDAKRLAVGTAAGEGELYDPDTGEKLAARAR